MMARRIRQLYERFAALDLELEQLMPAQYRKGTEDFLGLRWQEAVDASSKAVIYLEGLLIVLDLKVREAQKRSAASISPQIGMGDDDPDDSTSE
jgi:hypothetical protein